MSRVRELRKGSDPTLASLYELMDGTLCNMRNTAKGHAGYEFVDHHILKGDGT